MTDQTRPTSPELTRSLAAWRKSTFSGSTNECVEVAHAAGRVGVRDSKDPEGSALVFTTAEWSAFLAGAKRGEFDFS